MFEQVVKARYALARHRQGPLAEQRDIYLVHCADMGMAVSVRRTIAAYLLVIIEYLRLGERPDERISSAEIEGAADCWANSPLKYSTGLRLLS